MRTRIDWGFVAMTALFALGSEWGAAVGTIVLWRLYDIEAQLAGLADEPTVVTFTPEDGQE